MNNTSNKVLGPVVFQEISFRGEKRGTPILKPLGFQPIHILLKYSIIGLKELCIFILVLILL